MSCRELDELAAAYALGAVQPDEERAVSQHLATCAAPHAEARELIGAAAFVPAGLEPVAPSAALRARLMATVAATPQEHPGADAPRALPATASHQVAREPIELRRRWWEMRALPAALAAAALAAAVGLGAWNLNLSRELAARDAALRAVASADAAYAVTGSAGAGWVLDTDEGAIFLADELAALPADRIYELWLIGADGAPVAVGTLTDTEGVGLVELERDLAGATTFAITVEAERVEAPTSEPVLVATLEG